MLLEELEILAYQAMGEGGGDTDLINREGSLVEEDNTGEVLDVALNGGLRVVCTAFDVGELVTGEIEIENLSFVSLTAAHLVPPAT